MTNYQARVTVYTFGQSTYDLASRTHVMGIVNVTPDSFSDGGMFISPEKAVEHGVRLAEEGADFLDIGGESSRPGSDPVSAQEEAERILPVIENLSQVVKVPISVDTYKASVARQALAAGACIVNDITGLTHDTAMVRVISEYRASVVLMHMKGTPKNMQKDPRYENLIADIKGFLSDRARIASEAGISQIIVDPGIGFGKTVKHNLEIIKNLREFVELGFPVLVGPSRKSFIGTLLDASPDQRLEGTMAAVVLCAANGASIVRVHDVKEIRRALAIASAVGGA